MGGLRPPRKNTCLHRVRGMGNPGFPIPLHEGFKGGQNIRANVAYTALERPRAWLWSPRFDRLSAGSPAKLERGRG